MAPGNQVEIVKGILAAFGRRDLDALLGDTDPDIEVRPAVVGGLEGTVYRGHAGLRRFVADLDDTWSEFRVEAQEFRDLGDAVLVLGRTLARGRESGVQLDTASGFVFGLRRGKLHSLTTFVSREAALEAVGLPR